MKVTRTPRITWDYIVTLDDGFTWDARDLMSVLMEMQEGDDIAITDETLAQKLKSLNVVSHPGSFRHSFRAKKGSEFDAFYQNLKAATVAANKATPKTTIQKIRDDALEEAAQWYEENVWIQFQGNDEYPAELNCNPASGIRALKGTPHG